MNNRTIAICAILKDEHQYLKEWLDYHLNIGIDQIYLYEDITSQTHIEITKDYDNVHLMSMGDFIDMKHCLEKQRDTYNKFIEVYRDTVFAVNPESCVDKYVYPLAMNFKDFLSLILACGSTTAVEQIIGWSKEQFESFLVSEDNVKYTEQEKVLEKIRKGLKLEPKENPYE